MEDLILRVKELLSQRRFTAAVRACEEALSGDRSPSIRCRLLELQARAIVAEDGRWKGPARVALLEALELTEPGTVDRARIHCAFTAVYAANANPKACLEHRNAFVELRRALPASTALDAQYAHVEYNLALALHEAERLEEAEEYYLMARGAYQRLDIPSKAQLLADIELNLIDVFQENDRHREAKSLIDRVEQVLPDEKYGAHIRNRKGIYALNLGDHNAAILWVESGLGHPSCDVKTRAALMLTKARIACAVGQEDEANDCAIEAMRMAAIAQNARLGHRIAVFLQSLKKGGSL